MLAKVAVMGPAPSEAIKAAILPNSSSDASLFSMVCSCIPAIICSRVMSPPVTRTEVGSCVATVGDGLGNACRSQPHNADTLRPQLARPLPTLGFYGRPCDHSASYGRESLAVAACDREDHARSPLDHVPGDRPCGQELVSHGLRDRLGEIVEGHLGQRSSLNVVIEDRV